MHSRTFALVSLTALLASASALAASNDEVVKPVKTLVGSVRYGKDLAALKQLNGEEQGKYLFGDAWSKGTEAQRKEFIERFHRVFAKIAFPKVRQNFENLATILYDAPAMKGDKAEVGSTIVIMHPLKKQELKVKYSLAKDRAGAWKVVDAAVLGDSMLADVKEQVQKILERKDNGGWEGVLKVVREKDDETKNVQLK